MSSATRYTANSFQMHCSVAARITAVWVAAVFASGTAMPEIIPVYDVVLDDSMELESLFPKTILEVDADGEVSAYIHDSRGDLRSMRLSVANGNGIPVPSVTVHGIFVDARDSVE
jgi:hypothetical protein